MLIAVASVGFPGLASFEARASLADLVVVAPLSTVLVIVMLVPLIYYGRLLVIGLAPPDRVGGPVMPWRPHVARPDLGALRHWLRGTWDGNRAFTTASLAAFLAVLALATAAGAFGGPTAAAESVPTVAIPDEFGRPISPSARPSAGAPSASPSTVPLP